MKILFERYGVILMFVCIEDGFVLFEIFGNSSCSVLWVWVWFLIYIFSLVFWVEEYWNVKYV